MDSEPFQVDTEVLSQLREAVNSESAPALSVSIGKCFRLSYLRTGAHRTLTAEWTVPTEVRGRLAAEAAKSSFPYRQSLKLLSRSSINRLEILKAVDDIETLSSELTPKVEAVVAQMESDSAAQSLLEKFDDLFLNSHLFTSWHSSDYRPSDPRFDEHRVVIDCFHNFPAGRITAREVDYEHMSIRVKRSPLLKQVSVGLEDQCIASVLIREVVDLAVMLEDCSVAPALELFAYKPMSLRVVVVPVLSLLESRKVFYQRLIQQHWTQVIKLIETPVSDRYGCDFYENRSFEGLELLRNSDVRCYETYTLWRLHIPVLTLFHRLLWKNCKCMMRVIPLNISSSSVPVEITVMESPYAFSFSTNESVLSAAFSEPDTFHNAAYKQFIRLVNLTTVSNGSQGELQWTAVEEKCAGFLSDSNNLSDLLAICSLVNSLHEEGQFHGLLCASTIRVTSNNDHFLSLTAFSWENLPLLYFAIPLLDRKTIAPEVELIAKSLQQPSEPITFSKSDSFGLSALILTCGLSLCECNPRLHGIVTQGVNKDWKLRPKFAEVAEELRIALGEP